MWKKQLLRTNSDQEIRNPEEQLRQISGEDDQNQLKFYSSRTQIKKKSVYPRNDLRKNKSFNEDCAQISEWNSQRKTDLRENIFSKNKNDKPDKYEGLSSKFKQFEHIISKSQDQKDRFLSMTQLCHRYTFVNQHGSHSQYFTRKNQMNSSGQKEQFHPRNIELKLQMPQDYIMQKYQTNIHFFNQTKNNHIILPSIKKNQQESAQINHDYRVDQECMEGVLKLMGKFGRNKRIVSPTNKECNESENRKIEGKSLVNEEISKKKQKGLREKIYWKNKLIGSSQLSHLQEKLQNERIKGNKGIILFVGSLEKNQQKKKRTIKIEGVTNVYRSLNKKEKRKINKKISQSLEQCLILNRSIQKN